MSFGLIKDRKFEPIAKKIEDCIALGVKKITLPANEFEMLRKQVNDPEGVTEITKWFGEKENSFMVRFVRGR